MRRLVNWILRLPFGLILLGVTLGYIARTVHPPEMVQDEPNGFIEPFPEERPLEDLPILR